MTKAEVTRKIFIDVLNDRDAVMGEVFSSFSSDPPIASTQADHYFGGEFTSVIDQIVQLWKQIHPSISAVSDVGGVIAIIAMARDRRKDQEVKGLLDEVMKRLQEHKDTNV